MLRNGCLAVVGVLLATILSSCTVGPGTPLLDALNSSNQPVSTTVAAPEGYGPTGETVESNGLVNPDEREATGEYLKSLASE